MQVNISKLLAANVFASKEETRYYINGVLFEAKGGNGRLVATDGHRMIIFDLEGEFNESFKVTIPRQMIENIKPVKKIEIADIQTNGSEILITYAGTIYTGNAINGTYPDYERILPATDPEPVVKMGFNPAYLGDFTKVNRILGNKSEIVMTFFGEGNRVLIRDTYNQYTAILMPLRD